MEPSRGLGVVLLGLALCVAGCGDSESADFGTTDAATITDGAPAPDAGPALEPDASPSAPPITKHLVVIDVLGFAKELEAGVAPGFDVDGRVSDESDAEGCFQKDYVSPDGEPGVDNQLGWLSGALELAGIGAAEGLIQGAIEDGGLLLMLQFDGVDNLWNDPEITVMVRAGTGVPLLGTDGLLLGGQTFQLHDESPDSLAQTARIEDGWVYAGPFEAKLPILVFGMKYELTIRTARLKARWTEDGGLEQGVFGGGVPIEDLYEVGEIAAADDASVLPAIEAVFSAATDLAPDDKGVCTQVSAALVFTAVSGFLYQEPSAP